jgi:hypothetical protein
MADPPFDQRSGGKVRIEHLLAKAEKVELPADEPNMIIAKYQDGTEVRFTDVQVHWPSLVRELFKEGVMTRQAARKELRKFGEKL